MLFLNSDRLSGGGRAGFGGFEPGSGGEAGGEGPLKEKAKRIHRRDREKSVSWEHGWVASGMASDTVIARAFFQK
jgi:hypothetical protein